ncbi:hypothetical protein L6164_031590 [Bauhinia variegata]|uniref:Uncharacterized protein n=1 Tax=Bauhinia variegata TaxID=167791 RepID=A0ACB9LFX5_BAUVA|nr:hypothetical protein L6164_031590 [Bauhinia variegata]
MARLSFSISFMLLLLFSVAWMESEAGICSEVLRGVSCNYWCKYSCERKHNSPNYECSSQGCVCHYPCGIPASSNNKV